MNESIKNKLIKLSVQNIHKPNAKNKHFSFIIKKNRVLCMGTNNSIKTHPMALRFGYRFDAIHSEIDCIKRFPHPIEKLKHFMMVNVRIHIKTKKPLLSAPCAICQKVLSNFEISEMWYTTNSEECFKQLW